MGRGEDGARERLERERARLGRLKEAMTAGELGESQGASIEELSTYDNHPADIGSETFERGKDLALRGNLSDRLQKIDRALERLRDGRYGICEACGGPIGRARLEAVPEATLCIACQRRREAEERPDPGRRPVEEEVLAPPFGRSFDTPGPGYNGEDAWQEVALYGTSETPSDVPDNDGYAHLHLNPEEERGAVQPVEEVADQESVAGEVADGEVIDGEPLR